MSVFSYANAVAPTGAPLPLPIGQQPFLDHPQEQGLAVLKHGDVTAILKKMQSMHEENTRLRNKIIDGSEEYDQLLKHMDALAKAGKKREEGIQEFLENVNKNEQESIKLLECNALLQKELTETKDLLNEARKDFNNETKKYAALEKNYANFEKRFRELEDQTQLKNNLLQARQLVSIARNQAVWRMKLQNIKSWSQFCNEIEQLEFYREFSQAEALQKRFKDAWNEIGMAETDLELLEDLEDLGNGAAHPRPPSKEKCLQFLQSLPDSLAKFQSVREDCNTMPPPSNMKIYYSTPLSLSAPLYPSRGACQRCGWSDTPGVACVLGI